jgi:D-mannonate dehydratase
MNKKIIYSLAVFSMILGITASAQVPPVSVRSQAQVSAENQAIRAEMQNTIQTGKKNVINAKKEIRSEMSLKNASSSEAVNAARANLQEMRMIAASSSEAVRAAMANVRELQAAARNQREQDRMALQAKLQVVKDANKKAVVEKLYNNINDLNSNFVNAWTKNLSDLSSYVSALVSKASTASTTADLTAFNNAVTSANAAIAAAQTALTAQAAKTYTITVSTEANLKTDVSSVRNRLNGDLKSLRDLMQSAHSAVVKVLNEFNKIK